MSPAEINDLEEVVNQLLLQFAAEEADETSLEPQLNKTPSDAETSEGMV